MREGFSKLAASKHNPRSSVGVSRLSEQKHQCQLETPENALDRARVNAVIGFMKRNLHRSIERAEFAAVVNLSSSYVSHLFKVEVGVSPGKYVMRLRMEEACRLLSTTFLSVKQVMADVGYNNKSNFGRSFKLRFHVSPSEYRRQALSDQPPKDE